METCLTLREEEAAQSGCLPPIWYYSSYTCMVCTINSAGQARTRHDTSLGYLHLLAKEVDTNRHTETKNRKKKERKRKNGHVIAQTKTCSQGLGSGWLTLGCPRYLTPDPPSLDLPVSDQSQCSFLYFKSCNKPQRCPFIDTQTKSTHTNTQKKKSTPFFPKRS